MKALYSINKKSFYKKEQERIEALIEVPLLELVLQYLPHFQITQEEQDATWEIIAINLNKYQYQAALDSSKDGVDEVATLSGHYIKEIYDKLQLKFNSRYAILEQMLAQPGTLVKRELETRSEHILHELSLLKGFDIEVMAKLSKERYENQQRAKFTRRMGKEDEEVSESLKLHQGNVDHNKLQMIEQELDKKNKRIDHLGDENKKLLELNHELILELQQLRK